MESPSNFCIMTDCTGRSFCSVLSERTSLKQEAETRYNGSRANGLHVVDSRILIGSGARSVRIAEILNTFEKREVRN